MQHDFGDFGLHLDPRCFLRTETVVGIVPSLLRIMLAILASI